jgi:hypothetical protein
MEQMQPEQERLINLGELGLPGGEIPISEAGQYINVLNGAINYQKVLNPQGTDYGPTIDGSPFGIEGQIPLKYASGLAALLKLNGGDSENSTIPNGWTYVKTNSNGVDIYSDQAGFLRRSSDLGYDTDPNGMYLQYNQDEGRYIPINPQEYFGLEGNNKNYWGDYEGWDWFEKNIVGREPDNPNVQVNNQPQATNNIQTTRDIQSVIDELKETNPKLSATEIAQRMRQMMDPAEFERRTGLSMNSVIGRLQLMRW